MSARRVDVISRRPDRGLSRRVGPVNTYGMDWELHEGLTLRVEEAVAAAERDRLVRELRAARRAQRGGRARWWRRERLGRKEIAVGR